MEIHAFCRLKWCNGGQEINATSILIDDIQRNLPRLAGE
ncbi:hypothetical protein ABIA51_000666 [Erwinia aphidicola]